MKLNELKATDGARFTKKRIGQIGRASCRERV